MGQRLIIDLFSQNVRLRVEDTPDLVVIEVIVVAIEWSSFALSITISVGQGEHRANETFL